jgi:small-conductance mechanosensitive channel
MPAWWSSSFADPLWQVVIPLVLGLGGVALGWVVERIAMARLRTWVAGRGNGIEALFIDGVRGLPFFWCAMLGLWLATQSSTFGPGTLAVLNQIQLTALGLSLTVAAVRIAGALVGRLTSQTSILSNLTRIAVASIGLLVVLQSLGVSVTPLLTALGVGGLAVALALQDPLSNLFAGLQLLSTKKLHIGDHIRLDNGEEGQVSDISWRYTTILTGLNTTVMVPNAKLASVVMTSFSLPDPEVGLNLVIGVAYGSDLDHVERVAIAVASEVIADTPGAGTGFTPVLRFTSFAESAIMATITVRGRSFPDLALIRHALIKRVDTRFRAEGIAMPLPQRVVHLERGAANAPT